MPIHQDKKVNALENDQEADASNLMNLTAEEDICVIDDVQKGAQVSLQSQSRAKE